MKQTSTARGKKWNEESQSGEIGPMNLREGKLRKTEIGSWGQRSEVGATSGDWRMQQKQV